MNPAPPVSPARRPRLVSLFRYSLHDHEAMANTYPHALAALGARVDVHHFCGRGPARHWLADRPGVTVHDLPIRFRRGSERDKWVKTALWYFVALRAGRWARRHRADLLYIEETLPLLPRLLQRVSGRPVAISAADIFWDVYLPDGGPAGRLKRALVRGEWRRWRGLRGLITHTQAFKTHAIARGLDGARIHVVPEACRPDRFGPMDRAAARRATGIAPDELLLLHHGLLTPNKALDELIGYCAPALRARPAARLVFAGDGPLRRRMAARARSLGLDAQVRFTGWLPDPAALNALLNAADISIVMRAGRFADHFQVTANLLHSLACGCAILAARLDGIAELVTEGVNGLLFDPRDGAEFGRQLDRLLGDPALRRRLGAAALETARARLDPERVAAQWATALEQLMTADEGNST